MDIGFDEAVRRLVEASIGVDTDRRLSANLIVSVLAPKFSMFTEDHIRNAVVKAAVEAGATIIECSPFPCVVDAQITSDTRAAALEKQ